MKLFSLVFLICLIVLTFDMAFGDPDPKWHGWKKIENIGKHIRDGLEKAGPAVGVAKTITEIGVLTVSRSEYVNKRHTRPQNVRYFPKDTIFLKSDLIDKGCRVFLSDCPQHYKNKLVCGRHYDGQFKTFTSYCDMEFENCNSWRKWSMIKQDRC